MLCAETDTRAIGWPRRLRRRRCPSRRGRAIRETNDLEKSVCLHIVVVLAKCVQILSVSGSTRLRIVVIQLAFIRADIATGEHAGSVATLHECRLSIGRTVPVGSAVRNDADRIDPIGPPLRRQYRLTVTSTDVLPRTK